ncbi:POTRA domain-containing protein [Bradyrhizobium sp. TZ2]
MIKTSATHMLSFLTGGNVYDPDRIEQDREQLRLYYRSKGYADVRISSAQAEYDPGTKGFTLNFSIDEGPRYRFGDISVICNVPGLDAAKLRPLLLVSGGAVFDGGALDRSSEVLAIEMSKLGYPSRTPFPARLAMPIPGAWTLPS